MPRLTPYAAHEIAVVSSTPDGSGFPIGLMPGASPSDHASRQTLKTTAVRLPLGHSQFTGLAMPRRPPWFSRAFSYQAPVWRAKALAIRMRARAKPREVSVNIPSAAASDFAHLRVHVRNAMRAQHQSVVILQGTLHAGRIDRT